MSSETVPGDRAAATVLVNVPRAETFRIFTEEIDRWWRAGVRFRKGAPARSVVHLEPKLGGRLFEAVGDGPEARIFETGRVTAWEPPTRFVMEWRAVNFEPGEATEVEVVFAESASGTLVTVTHRGWSKIRPDHPVRHGQDVRAFLRTMGMWWGDLLFALRDHTAR